MGFGIARAGYSSAVSGRSSALGGLAGRVRRALRPTQLERRVAALGIAAGDLAIDCGANVGNVTAALASRGAFVHAFEPNPDAFAVLAGRFRDSPSVVLHPQAVLDRAGRARLYLHVDAVTGRTTAMPQDRQDAVAELLTAHAKLPRPTHLGRGVGAGAQPPVVERAKRDETPQARGGR